MNRIWLVSVVIVILTACQITDAQEDSGDADSIIACDFETQEELSKWEHNGSTVELSDEHVTSGKKSVKVTYETGKGLKVFKIETGKHVFNLSGCTHLLIDVFTPVNMEVTIKLKSNSGKKKWDREFTLEPAAETISISFEKVGIDPSSISYINFFISSPRQNIVLFIDNIRGVKSAPSARKGPKIPEKPDDELF